MIKLRIDVDYPFPSRAKSFLNIAFGIKKNTSEDFLRNARILATMINESPKQVNACWFFTPYTIPDKRLLNLLNPERHEVALHVANDAYREWKILENETNRKVTYYTIHGTSTLIAQLLWRRKIGQKQAKIPSDFPLKSYHDYITYPLDSLRFLTGFEHVKKDAEKWIEEDAILSIHPDWLFKRGEKNRRGPYYDVLKALLDVDGELETLLIKKRQFLKVGRDIQEYEKSISPTETYLEKLNSRGIDVFTFLDRKWCCSIPNPSSTWIKECDNVALLEIKDYASWWEKVGKKTRNMVRRAEKSGVRVIVEKPTEKLAEGIWAIYNETPIRQGRAFPHFSESLQMVTQNVFSAKNSTFIGAYLQEELVGFIQILYGDSIAIISQILSLQKHWDKALNNSLLAKAVEFCATQGERWLMYGRIGNHPSLDRFKESNGFVEFPLTRYYVPLTGRGRIAIRLGLHRELKDGLPNSLKGPLIPFLNWLSRNRMLLKLRLKK